MKENQSREKLIITADDFGVNHKTNAKIILLAKKKKIDRVSVLINEHFSKQEIATLIHTGVKIDIHFDLPIDIKINKLSHSESAIKRAVLFVNKYLSKKISTKVIEAEWERQLIKFEKFFNKMPDGINSHQHIHYFTPYFKTALLLATRHNINYVRYGGENLLGEKCSIFRILSFFQNRNKGIYHASNLSSSDYMTSLDWVSSIKDFTDSLPEGKTELVCHPERDNEFVLIKEQF